MSTTAALKARTFSHEHQFSSVDDRGLEPFPTHCPDWCTVGTTPSRAFHFDAEPFGGHPQERKHEGSTFGAVQVYGWERIDAPGVIVLDYSVSTRAARPGLRQLAADALAAAEWMEAQR